MNRFPVLWAVQVALPETKMIEKHELTRILDDIGRKKSVVKNGQFLIVLFLVITIPYLLLFALPIIWFILSQGEPVDMVAVVKIACPLLLASIYLSLAAFTFVNAISFAAHIRLLAELRV